MKQKIQAAYVHMFRYNTRVRLRLQALKTS